MRDTIGIPIEWNILVVYDLDLDKKHVGNLEDIFSELPANQKFLSKPANIDFSRIDLVANDTLLDYSFIIFISQNFKDRAEKFVEFCHKYHLMLSLILVDTDCENCNISSRISSLHFVTWLSQKNILHIISFNCNQYKVTHKALEFDKISARFSGGGSLFNRLSAIDDAYSRLLKAIETTEIGVTITDAEGSIIFTNPADARMHGFEVWELIGQPANIFAIPESRRTAKLVDLQEIPFWKRESVNRKKDSSVFPVELISNFIKDSRGKVIGKVTICRDITERRKAEEALMLSEQQLREANATKDRFFSIIAHDLKNPFSSLIMLSQLLIRKYDSLTDEQRIEMLQDILQSSQNTAKLLMNLLDWANMQTGKIDFKPTTICLFDLVIDEFQNLDSQAATKKILLECRIPRKLECFADRNMLSVVVRNLVSNGIKYSHADSRVRVEAEKSGNIVKVSVIDNGIGIDVDSIGQLFKIEHKSSRRGTEGEKGTGLGLILCREFIEQCGGNIGVKSAPDKGSTFYFTIPSKK